MPRTPDEARRWTEHGTKLITGALAGLDEAAFDAATALPGWTRRHLVAHLAANAEAIGNLVHWAATGERTPMYSSAEQRTADIEAGSHRAGPDLVEWFTRSAATLDAAMDALNAPQWDAEVVTAQGRTVAAGETTWMRAREVLVHAVDLDAGVGFDDLPPDFLSALCDDIAAKRSAAGAAAAGPALDLTAVNTAGRWQVAGSDDAAPLRGTLAAVAAYLAGRGAAGVTGPDGSAAPALPAWL